MSNILGIDKKVEKVLLSVFHIYSKSLNAAMSMTKKAPLVYEVMEATLDAVAEAEVAEAPVAELPVADALDGDEDDV